MSNMRVVLLSCCAPCSAGAIKQLADGAINGVDDFIVLFYNPNIFPESEYTKRMHEQIRAYILAGYQFNPANWEQGFIDQYGVFMTREEALKVATEAGQINVRRWKTSPAHLLFSEDLY